MSEIQDLIQHALDKDYNKSNEVFGEIMTVKLNDLLDQEREAIADKIFNGVDPEDDDLDDDIQIDDEDLDDIEDIEDDIEEEDEEN